MLQRRIPVLIAALLVGAQVGVAGVSAPSSTEVEYTEPLPAQTEPVEPAAASDPAEAGSGALATIGEYVRRITTGIPAVVPDNVFPSTGEEVELLPALAAYLDQKAATQLAGASGDVFPSTGEEVTMLPVQVAFFDRLEATRLAASNGTVARSEVSAPPVAEEHAKVLASQAEPSDRETPDSVGLAEGGAVSESSN